MRSASRRRQGAVALLLLFIAFVVPMNPARAASTDPTESGLDWLSRELSNNGHRIPSPFGDEFTDWGLTIDFLLGLAGGGRTTAPETLATTNNLLANTLSYVTGVDFGSPNDRYAGPMAKLLYATKILGVDASNLGGLNIESELRARMQTTGPQAGRFSDQADFGDFSNGFGQAFALLALARTSGGIPSEAVTFLLAQQCPGGGFRLFYDSGDTCTNDSEADPDATGLTIEALVTTGAPGGSNAASRAISWLVARQDASGAFGGAGPTVALNANTTAIVGRALRIAGQTGAADKAGAWLLSLQLTQANVGTGPAAPDIGVISYDVASRDASIANGVPAESRDQFRRATSQGVLAFPKIILPPVVNAAARRHDERGERADGDGDHLDRRGRAGRQGDHQRHRVQPRRDRRLHHALRTGAARIGDVGCEGRRDARVHSAGEGGGRAAHHRHDRPDVGQSAQDVASGDAAIDHHHIDDGRGHDDSRANDDRFLQCRADGRAHDSPVGQR